MKKFSIITSTLNSAETIHDCIMSVLNQSIFNDCEHIIIDGKSKDNTLNIIKSFDHIKFISEYDKGVYSAWNKGLKLVDSEYVIFLGSDDTFYSKNTLENVSKKITDKDSIYYGKVIKQTQDKKKKFYKETFNFENKIMDPPIFLFPPHPATFFPAKTLKEVGFDEKFKICGDTDNYIKMLRKCKIINLNLTTTYFTLGGLSNSRKNSFLKWKEKNYLRKKYKIIIPKKYILFSLLKAIIYSFISIFINE